MKDSAIQNKIVYDDSCQICTYGMELLQGNNDMENTIFVKRSSDEGQQLIGSTLENPDSILYFKGSKLTSKSEAIIQIMIDRGGFYRLAGILRIIPASLLDKFYDSFAKRRHKFKLHP